MTKLIRRSMVGRQGNWNLYTGHLAGIFLPVNTPNQEYLFLPWLNGLLHLTCPRLPL